MLGEILKVSERSATCPCFLNIGLWPGPEGVDICNEERHVGQGPSCAERLEETWRKAGVRRPSEIEDPEPLPHTLVTVIDH